MLDVLESANIASPPPATKSVVKLKGVALPTEHGSWSMVFEPMIAGLAVAFSVAGLFVSVAFLGAFLMRQPLRVLLAERAAGRRLPQGETARRFLLIYTALFAAGAIGTVIFAPANSFLPLLLAAPLAAIQIYYDSARQSRKLVPELAGAVAISSSAAVILFAGGLPAAGAAIWIILVCRWVPSISYVRERLLLEKGKSFAVYSPVLLSAAAVAVTAGLAALGLGPWLVAVMMIVLFVRTVLGLSRFSRRRKAMQIGVLEIVFGALMVLCLILGYRLHL